MFILKLDTLVFIFAAYIYYAVKLYGEIRVITVYVFNSNLADYLSYILLNNRAISRYRSIRRT